MAGSWSGAAHISMSAGGAGAVGSGAFTIAALVKPTTLNGAFVGGFKSNASQRQFSTSSGALFGSSDFSSGYGLLTINSWYVAVISKPSGSAHYRFGLWPYASNGSGSMSHGEATGAANHADALALDEIRLGDDALIPHCDISVVGLWTSQLSDAQLDTLVSIHLSAWAALAPASLITLNGWTGSTGAADVVGSSTFSSLTGTVGAAADAPSFDFSLASVVQISGSAALGSLTAAMALQNQVLIGGSAQLGGPSAAMTLRNTVLVGGSAALGGLAASMAIAGPHPVVTRPNTGLATRPNTGLVARPNTGTVTRQNAGLVIRPNTGLVARP